MKRIRSTTSQWASLPLATGSYSLEGYRLRAFPGELTWGGQTGLREDTDPTACLSRPSVSSPGSYVGDAAAVAVDRLGLQGGLLHSLPQGLVVVLGVQDELAGVVGGPLEEGHVWVQTPAEPQTGRGCTLPLTRAFPRRQGLRLSPHIFVDLEENFVIFKVGVPPAVGVGVQRLQETRQEPEELQEVPSLRARTAGLTWSSMVTSSLEQPDFALEMPGWMIISLRNWE